MDQKVGQEHRKYRALSRQRQVLAGLRVSDPLFDRQKTVATSSIAIDSFVLLTVSRSRIPGTRFCFSPRLDEKPRLRKGEITDGRGTLAERLWIASLHGMNQPFLSDGPSRTKV